MCLIIVKPKGVSISQENLTKYWNSNPHFSGISFIDKNKLVIFKAFEDVHELTYSLETLKNYEVVIHFRFATSGKINEENTHPFKVHDWALHHNGVIPGLGNNEFSDTYIFSERLNRLPKGSIVPYLNEVSRICGRFALHTLKGVITIGKWKEDEGILYSNDSFVRLNKTNTIRSNSMYVLMPPTSSETLEFLLKDYDSPNYFEFYSGDKISQKNEMVFIDKNGKEGVIECVLSIESQIGNILNIPFYDITIDSVGSSKNVIRNGKIIGHVKDEKFHYYN